MRKNVIALMLIIPLLFIFVLFSSGNVASLGVEIPVKSIEIKDKPQNGTLAVDLADMPNENLLKLEVEIFPENASNKNITFRVYNIDGEGKETEGDDVVKMEGNKIVPIKAGSVRIVAISNDGGFTDSIKVIVSSSKPYDFDFSMYRMTDSDRSENLLFQSGENGYSSSSLQSGNYVYHTKVIPSGYYAADIRVEQGFASISAGMGTILLPFSGKTVLSAKLKDGLINGQPGVIEKTVELNVEKPESDVGFTINGSGESSHSLTVAENEGGGEELTFYVEGSALPAVSGDDIQSYAPTEIKDMPGCYELNVKFNENHGEETYLIVSVGGKTRTVTVNFSIFAFTVTSNVPITENGNNKSATILAGMPFEFYAVPSVAVSNVNYNWTVNGTDEWADDWDNDWVNKEDSDAKCTITANNYVKFYLTVNAVRGSIAINPVEIEITVIRNVTSVNLRNSLSDKVQNSLAKIPALAGKFFDETGTIQDKLIDMEIICYNNATVLEDVNLSDDLVITVSDRRLLTAIPMFDSITLDPRGTGEAVVSVSWKGNEAFGAEVSDSVTFFVAANATEVYTSDQLSQIVESEREVVLGADIMLGTNADGTDKTIEERRAILDSHKIKSTFNIEYYKNMGKEDQASVCYAMEFKNNVYGNGYSINAEKFTNAQDGSGVPQLFKGPLAFVSFQEVISVAGQDNIAFLVRMNDITISNVTLLGCSDDSLLDENGQIALSKLKNVGTTLEINGDGVNILNCRVRNGRNVVKVYGGNKSGSRYFIDSLAANTGCDGERIVVNIEGCILTQAREFILKLGANRALRANAANGGNEPDLVDLNNKAYKYQTNEYIENPDFYSRYVMTDVTLKDSVLETSGLFTIGVESNFSGSYLSLDVAERFEGWAGTGGTSFASVLRLCGDVRLYDWKDISLVDSSTLIEANVSLGELAPMVKLDIEAMIKFVRNNKDGYRNIVQDYDGKEYVHGGIACYGGGKNYAQISFDGLKESLRDFTQYNINIGVLAESDDPILQRQGQVLPAAAGTKDFRFFMYGADSQNNYDNQLADSASGNKYDGVKPVKIFG